MIRSLLLVITFLFFSAIVPCLCLHSVSAFGEMEVCSEGVSSGMSDHGNLDFGVGAGSHMDALLAVESWRNFFSIVTIGAFSFFLSALYYFRASLGYPLFTLKYKALGNFVFRPPDDLDERALLSNPILRALRIGALHAKIAC